MKALLIDGQAQSITLAELSDATEIAATIGYDTVINDEIDDDNKVYFDEDCFIRGTEGRFRIDSLAPIAGKAVVLGAQDGGAADVVLELEQLRSRVTFL